MLFTIFTILIFLVIAFIVWRIIAFQSATKKRDSIITNRLQPVIIALQSSLPLDQEIITSLAKTPLTRNDLQMLLKFHKKGDLFPKSESTAIKQAESNLARYLLHANEANEEITQFELIKTISIPRPSKQRGDQYFIFKFFSPRDQKWYVGMSGDTTYSPLIEYSSETIEQVIEEELTADLPIG